MLKRSNFSPEIQNCYPVRCLPGQPNMFKTFLPLALGVVLAASPLALRAQGCSDAGFCTMGALKPDQPFNKKIEFRLRSMELTFYRGKTTLTPIVYVATADMNFSLNQKTSFQVKLPYQAVSGRLGNTSSLGDVSLCVTRNVFTNGTYDINISVGGKIPTNRSNLDENGRPLPMYYQTSLGTYDGVAGISLISKKWLFATGIQHAFNRNGNKFLWSRWEGSGESMDYIHRYSIANGLRRGTDVMFRVERNIRFSRLNFTLGLLPIYRITHDRITLGTGDRVAQAGSTGLALTALFSTGYSFNVQSGIKMLLGQKIVNRDPNTDGLKREFVSTLGYYYRF